MSARRRSRGAWLAGARDGDDVFAGRPSRERPAVGRYFDDDEPAAGVVRASRSRREGWNRHVASATVAVERTGGRARRTAER
jgi:hypothetical protein